MIRAVFTALAIPVLLAGCTAEPIWATKDQVDAAIYRHSGPPSLTMFTMVNNRSDQGAHAGLMINGSHRVIFDPAGTFRHPQIPERNDVHFGIVPSALDLYIDYHARETYRVVTQTVEVPPEVAEKALQLVQEYGAVPKAQCTIAITRILQQLPGFEDTRSTYWPGTAQRQFGERPGVVTRVYRDDSPDNNRAVLQTNI